MSPGDIREIQAALLVLAGVDAYHPAETAREIARLAPNAELIEGWRGQNEVGHAVSRIIGFLKEHGSKLGLGGYQLDVPRSVVHTTSPLRDTLLELACRRRLVPFLAAGTTIELCGPWSELCTALRREAATETVAGTRSCKDNMAGHDDMMAIEALRSDAAFGDKWVRRQTAEYLDQRIREKVRPAELTTTPMLDLQRAVARARFLAVVTTNFDTLLEDAIAGDAAFGARPLYRSDMQGGITLSSDGSTDWGGTTPLLKIHGDVKHGIDEMVMGYDGHEHYQSELAPLRDFLSAHGAGVVLYGASLRAEANWEQILEALFSPTARVHAVPLRCLITADPEDAAHEALLWSQYRIATWRSPPHDWTAARQCLLDLCSASAAAAAAADAASLSKL